MTLTDTNLRYLLAIYHLAKTMPEVTPLAVAQAMGVTKPSVTEEGEEPESYDITGSTEADMNLNRISDESPVGAALIGHKPGDEVDVTLPNGSIVTYKLLTVTRSK